MNHLSLNEMREEAAPLREAMAELIADRTFTTKKEAQQVRFIQALLERMLEPLQESAFDAYERGRLVQLKFEITDRLRRYYLGSGRPLRFLFTVVHQSAKEPGLQARDWPNLSGYRLFVRDTTRTPDLDPSDHFGLHPYLERVIAEAANAEFQAYMALPDIRSESLERWFVPGSPAYHEILNLLHRHQKKGWVLSIPMNPSTMRILDIAVREVTHQQAMVQTTEYWYLCWHDRTTLERTYTYRETNRQSYILQTEEGTWKVFQNLRPMPSTVAPNRKPKRT